MSEMIETEKYLARTFLNDQHYKKIHKSLSSRWDRMHSLSAAMKLMEKYGVEVSPEEEERLSGMEEAQQISALVTKMPQQSNEQFQQFFLQLQLLVSTASRVRQALEEGRSDHVEQALTDAENTGISPYILRMAVVQAGSEVSTLRESHTGWMKESNSKCSKLIRGQEDAMAAQKRLAAAQAQLGVFTQHHSEKAKKVVMNFASKSAAGTISTCFGSWKTITKQEKLEALIRKDYADRLDEAEARLGDYKQKQLEKARGLCAKKTMACDLEIKEELLKIWKDSTVESKWVRDNKDKLEEMEARLSNLQGSQAEKTRKVMMKMSQDSDQAILIAAWQAFVAFHKEYAKDREYEDHVEEIEKKVKSFVANKADGAKKMLNKMSAGSDNGLITMTFTGWKEVYEERKRENELENMVANSKLKVQTFQDRTKGAGMNAMERASYHVELGLLLKVWGAWLVDSKATTTLNNHLARIEGKRAQLVGVQQMFRKFATELETNLKASQDSSRDLREGPPPGARRMQRTENTVSLPDINQRSASGRHHHNRGYPASPGSRR